MFDLSIEISEWKLSLLSKETFSDQNIDELESHLLEQIDNLKSTGLDDEEAYWVAQKRMGSVNSLNIEYEKINGLDIIKRRLYWVLFGVVAVFLYSYFTGIISFLSYSLIRIIDINIFSLTYLIYSVQEIIFLIPLIIIVWLMFGKKVNYLERILMKFMTSINGRRIGAISIIILVLGLITNYFFATGRESINLAVSQAEGFHEYLQLIRILAPANLLFNSLLVILAFYFSHRKTYNIDLLCRPTD